MITVCEREMNAAVRKHTLAGVACEVFDLEVPTTTTTGEESGETRRVRALAKQVQMHAYNQMVDNVCFLEVKPETEVKVRVPVATQGEDVSPGVKRGGFVQIMRQTVPVRCRSDSIPKRFLMDVSTLDAGKVIKIGDVTVPEGVKLLDADLNLPLVRIGGRVKSAE
jgi:large subunit ribosomal protein L25